MYRLNIFLLLSFLGGSFCMSEAQEAVKPRLSPLEMKTVKYENTYIKVTYCRPHKRNRVIFGELVPYGEVWRTGANEATEITFTQAVTIKGTKLKAGTYTVFTIPEEEQWTLILNNDLGQWGAYNYNKEKDQMRIKIPVESTDVVYEPFTIEFELQDDMVNLIMMWDRTKASLPISFID